MFLHGLVGLGGNFVEVGKNQQALGGRVRAAGLRPSLLAGGVGLSGRGDAAGGVVRPRFVARER